MDYSWEGFYQMVLSAKAREGLELDGRGEYEILNMENL